MSMPPHVRSALETLLEGVSRKDLAARAALLTDTYRSAGPSAAAVAGPLDALAYAVARMPATYAATLEALRRAVQQSPDLQPRSVLDLGSGPGTASLAALEMWPAITHVTMLEGLAAFRDLAAKFLRVGETPAPAQAEIVAGDLRAGGNDWAEADLVVAAYVLVEMSQAQARSLVLDAYAKARQALVLVEPGTTAGFARIRMARDGSSAVPHSSHHARTPWPAPWQVPTGVISRYGSRARAITSWRRPPRHLSRMRNSATSPSAGTPRTSWRERA